MTQVSSPNFSGLFDKMYDAWKHEISKHSMELFQVIAAECDGFMSQRLLPQYAESCAAPIKENKWGGSTHTQFPQFSYIDEDGQAHTTRRIDWNYIFG